MTDSGAPPTPATKPLRLQGTCPTSRQTAPASVPRAINSEVVLQLPGGGKVAAVITNDGAVALGRATGAVASAVCKASSVIPDVAA